MTRGKYLAPEELQLFFSAIEKSRAKTPVEKFVKARDMAMFDLTYVCGLRESEICMLRKDSFKPATCQIYVERLKRRKPWGRWHDLDSTSVGLLHKWLVQRDKRARRDNPYLFTGVKYGLEKLVPQTVWHRFRHYAGIAGIEGRSPHSLRHSCGMMLAMSGANAFAIMSHLGHASVSSSEEYVQMRGPEAREANRKMNESLREYRS